MSRGHATLGSQLGHAGTGATLSPLTPLCPLLVSTRRCCSTYTHLLADVVVYAPTSPAICPEKTALPHINLDVFAAGVYLSADAAMGDVPSTQYGVPTVGGRLCDPAVCRGSVYMAVTRSGQTTAGSMLRAKIPRSPKGATDTPRVRLPSPLLACACWSSGAREIPRSCKAKRNRPHREGHVSGMYPVHVCPMSEIYARNLWARRRPLPYPASTVPVPCRLG